MRLLPLRIPGRIVGDIDQLIPHRSDAGSEDCNDFGGLVADVERGVHDVGWNEGGIAGAD